MKTITTAFGGLGLGLLACLSQALAEPRPDVAELFPGVPAGYLGKDQKPDSIALLPAPPGGGAAADLDEQMHDRAQALRGTARWDLAVTDASLDPEMVIDTFECALGSQISREATPRLFQLLQRVMVDTGMSTEGAKKKYQALRPFMAHGETMCTPDEDAELRADGSYPSGHTALGWGAALALAEIDPGNATAILARGRAFGESRIICNVHWQSDIIGGRFMGSATMAQVRASAEFGEDVVIARAELAAARKAGLTPSRDCTAEAAALAIRLPGAQ